MKLLSFVDTGTSYQISIWLDETQIDRNGDPSPEWTFNRQYGKVQAMPDDTAEPVPISPEQALTEVKRLAQQELDTRVSRRNQTEQFSSHFENTS